MPSTFRLDDFAAPSSSAPASGEAARVPRRLRGMLSLGDFEAAARQFLPAPIFAYVSGGCQTNRSLRGNRSAFEAYQWLPRVLHDTSRRTLVVKGILHPADAVQARACGADGLILSNHGGRQLDSAVSPMRMLPAVVDAVGADYPVMIDSGFRRGNDVLQALALGTKFVLVGRSFNYAGAVAEQVGVLHAIGILASEVLRNMALIGVGGCLSHHVAARSLLPILFRQRAAFVQ